jgi:isopentenyldiphosphate isomerase
MPDEIITLYTKESPDSPVACARNEYYDNDFTKYANQYPGLIDVFLFNSHGDVLLQKRGRMKRSNPGRLHTTVGGHINWGENASFSVVHECMEEVGATALVFPKEKFDQAYQKLKPYTNKAALLREESVFFRDFRDDPDESRRYIKDRIWFYFGLYDGPIDTPDRQSAGYEWIDLKTLKEEFLKKPDDFTAGLKTYIENYGTEMEKFIETYCKQ